MEERQYVKKNDHETYQRLLNMVKNDEYRPGNKETILRFLRDCELGKTILKGQKKKIGYGRLMKYISLLKFLDHHWLKKPFDQVTEEEMDNFVLGLERGTITKTNGKPYTSETKITIKKFLRKFYKWLLGNNENYPDLVKYIDTSGKLPEIHPLTKEEADKLIGCASKLSHKFVVAFLFDTGARAEEFLNVKLSDLTKENGCYKVRLRISKTKARTISLPLYTEIIDDYLNSFDGSTFVAPLKYSSLRKMLTRLGQRVLGKNVYPHLFRHSSATFYANRLSHYQMCYRYGWSISSTMPSRYIDFNGIADQEATSIVKKEIDDSVKKENKQLRNEVEIMKSSLMELQQKEQERLEVEKKKQLEEQLHSELFARSSEIKVNVSDVRELLFQVLKSDDTLIKILRELID